MNHSIHSSTTTSSNNSSVVLKQLDISPSDIETEDVIFYAKLIGIDPISEPELLWIAKAGLLSPLPDGWQAIEDQKGRLYYYDKRKKKSSWEHPSDPYYRFLVEHYRHFNISTTTINNHNNNNSLLLLSGGSGSSLLTLDENNNNNNNNNPKSVNSVTAPRINNNHNGNSLAMNEYSTGSNQFSLSKANLHFFDDENDDDGNPDQENELAEADRQQQNEKNNGEKSIPTKEEEEEEEEEEEDSGGGIHNQWVTITTTNNSSLPSSNIDLQSKGIQKLNDGDEEKEAEPEASIEIESVELEIENPDQSLEEISEDVAIEEIVVVDSDEDHQSVAPSKETKVVQIKEMVGTFSMSSVPETRKIENNDDDDDDDDAGHDNDDDVLIHSDLMNNLIQEDLFNKNQDDDDDDYQQEDSMKISNGRYGNHNHGPRSAMVNSGNNVNSDEKASKLSIVPEESDDGDEPESLLLATDDATFKAVDRRRMSQMGPINHQEPENSASTMGAKEKEEDGKTCILERINEQHQSLSSDGFEILLNNVKEKQEQQERPARTESSMPNDDDIDAASLLADDYDQEEFDSESNSRMNENGRVFGRMEQDNGFNEITEQMQRKITALREQILAELNECNESLRKQMNEEIVSLNQRIESVERQNNDSVELLSRKIEELNLSLASKQPNSDDDFRNIQQEMLNNHIEDLKCKLMKELNANIEQQLMRIDVKVEKTIKEQVDKVSFESGQKLAIKQEQMLQRELSSLKSESINRDQIIEIAKQLYNRMNEDFRSAMVEVRQLCLKTNEQIETLRNTADQDRNFTKVNFLRLEKNITQLELKRDVVVDALNKNKSTVTSQDDSGLEERQKKLIHDLIDLKTKSLNGRLNELNDKIESIMQQINSKLKLSDSGMATIPKRGTIQLDGGEMKVETESNYTNRKMLSAIENKEEKDITNSNENIKTTIHNDIDPTVANVEDSNSKIMKVGNDDRQQQPLTRNNDSTVYDNKNNDDDICYNNKNDTDVVVNCSNRREKNDRKESLPVDHESQSEIEPKKNKHEQLLEQCIDLKELLKLFMVSNPNPKRERKRIEPKRKPMIKSKSTNQIRNYKKDERIQGSEGISSDYLSEPSSDNDNQSLSTTNNDQFYGKKRLQPQWSRSTPDLNRKHRRDYPFGQAIIMPTNNMNNNIGSKMNRSYANLSSSYGRRSEIIARQFCRTAMQNNDAKSNSLLTTIKQTSNQLKQELKNLETLGNYSSGYCDDDDWLKSLHNNDRRRRSQIDSQSPYSDNINHQEDQLLMFRLRSIRDSVNDRLTKISSAIQQQKITQI